MIEIFDKEQIAQDGPVDDIVVLDHIQREKGRLKVISRNGEEVRLFLERGNILQRDQVLQSSCNQLLRVKLAKEPVVTARATSWQNFCRACYHLGNRHTRVQIGNLWVRFLYDPVLVELVEKLGLVAEREEAEFEPESGAYGHGHAGKASTHHHHSDC